jgi:hypothetical protein
VKRFRVFLRRFIHYYGPVRLLGHFPFRRVGSLPSVSQYPGSLLPG